MNASLWLPDGDLDATHRDFAQSIRAFAEQKLLPHARALHVLESTLAIHLAAVRHVANRI